MSDKSTAHLSEADRSIASLVDAATGAIAHPTYTVKELGELAKHAMQGQLKAGLVSACERLAKKGRVNPSFLNTPHGIATFQEVLRALDLDDTDFARFEAVKNIFLNDALSDDDKSEILTVRLIKLAASLTGSEILIIKTLAENPELNEARQYINTNWEADVAKATGHKHAALITDEIAHLTKLGLIEKTKLVLELDNYNPSPALSSLGKDLYAYTKDPEADTPTNHQTPSA